MPIKKLPYGISNYERIVEENMYYVDKTKYIEQLENLSESYIMCLRPRKFGKTLFTSVLENYYDIMKADSFEKLYGKTYIGKNPTKLKNSYHILRFNFSGIDTDTEESTIRGFKREISSSIGVFVKTYGLDFYVDNNSEAEDILDNLFKSFKTQRGNEKIYVIIDEYDHFANELLGFRTEEFKNLVSKNGKVRKWYEILKKGTETVVDRIFITGVAPITLDSLTSGFNISKDITRNPKFNEMFGFTLDEVKELLDYENISKEEQEKILPIMKQYYDGYRFALEAETQIYNSNMCLYFLSDYIMFKRLPSQLIDMNIASDYSKLGKMLELCQSENRREIIEKTVSGEGIVSEITEKFNPAIDFTETDLVSMLFYLGYLTISENVAGYPKLSIPNKVMKEIYADYFLKYVGKEIDLDIDKNYIKIALEIAFEGNIDNEKYVKLIFYCIAINLKIFSIKSEMEVNRKYPDILLIPRDTEKGYNAVMIEFKYLKKGEGDKLAEKQKEAREQIEEYANFDDIKNIPNLNKYTVVAVNDKIYIEKI